MMVKIALFCSALYDEVHFPVPKSCPVSLGRAVMNRYSDPESWIYRRFCMVWLDVFYISYHDG